MPTSITIVCSPNCSPVATLSRSLPRSARTCSNRSRKRRPSRCNCACICKLIGPMNERRIASMKVLLADDSSSMRLILRNMLRQFNGVEIVEARDGRDALNLLEAHTVDLLLLDLHMPVMDGL